MIFELAICVARLTRRAFAPLSPTLKVWHDSKREMIMTSASAPDHSSALKIDTLRVSLTPGVGPLMYRALIERFGDAKSVLQASEAELRGVSGVGAKVVAGLRRSAESEEAAGLLSACEQYGVEVLLEGSDSYPPLLNEIVDPPSILFVRGSLTESDRLGIAIVGARQATPYGRRVAERLAGELAGAGMTIVSGLARGIDTAAHRGALKSGGRTIGVLGGGVLNVYPPEHGGLADEVVESAALISESPPFQAPYTGSFPRRNRLITGMTLGVVVVEASFRSGALISARLASEQGREVFAVPGRIDTATARGCHRLIRDGAKLVESVDDVLEELGPLAHPARCGKGEAQIRNPVELKLNAVERAVLEQTKDEATNIDDVIERSQLPTPQVLATISALEMRHLIRRVSGCQIVRAKNLML